MCGSASRQIEGCFNELADMGMKNVVPNFPYICAI